jgi:hypothetical protein
VVESDAAASSAAIDATDPGVAGDHHHHYHDHGAAGEATDDSRSTSDQAAPAG